MENLRIAKQGSNHTLAHLYEHPFFMHLDALLRHKVFFEVVDYSIDASPKTVKIEKIHFNARYVETK